MSEDVLIIGAGVNGITTALTLQCLGYDTQIIAEHTYDDLPETASHPEFASLFPAASVIPHSVYSDRLLSLFELSQSLFFDLRKQAFPGITFHKHFEVFEFEVDPPPYLEKMLHSKLLDQLDPDAIPRHSQSPALHGWVFDCLFADWPNYFSGLISRYKKKGGTITQKKLVPGDIPQLPAQTIINCSGTGSAILFDEPLEDCRISRGHILHKPGAPLIKGSDHRIISYNYTPRASVYSNFDNQPCDLYCYPRKDGWILGGSRQTGTLDKMNWEHSSNSTETYHIDGRAIPAQIIDINRQILAHTYELDLSVSDKLAVNIGYRFTRSTTDGLRLERDQNSGYNKAIFHNYGHGGAGVTLSWGCALALAEQIAQKKTEELKSFLLQEL